MLFAGPLGADPVIGPVITSVPMPTGPMRPCPDSLLTTQRAQLFSSVTQGIFKMQQAIENGAPVDRDAAMALADQSRRLGQVQGAIDACAPSGRTMAQLQSLVHQNSRDLLASEVKINEMWMVKNYSGWLTMRTKIQMYHREVTKLQHWITKAAAAPVINIQPVTAITDGGASVTVIPGGGGLPGMSTSPIVDPVFEPSEQPFYKRGAFWGVVGGLLAIGTGVALYAHR